MDNERKGVLGSRKEIASPLIDSNMRMILVDWLISVHKIFKLKPDSFFSSINILDAVLSRDASIKRNELQLVGVATLYLASKYHEINSLSVEDIIGVTNETYNKKEIIEMENKIFKLMGCNLNIPYEMEYFRPLSIASSSLADPHIMGKNLMTVMTMVGSHFLISVIATATRKIVVHLYQTEYVNYFKIPENVVDACAYDIIAQCKIIQGSRLKAYTQLESTRAWAEIFNKVCNLSLDTPVLSLSDNKYYRKFYYLDKLTIPLIEPSLIPPSLAKLGEGTFGIVNKIEYQNKLYAVKKIKQGFTDEILNSSNLREISILLSLNYPYIIKLKHISSDFHSLFFDLGVSDLDAWTKKNDPFSNDLQIILADQLLSALSYLYDMGCLHRDIKPQNVIVYENLSKIRFELSDFGQARGCQISTKDNAFTHEVTTLWYRAPEILLGTKTYNAAVDVWSMICTLYQCASQKVFMGDSEINQLIKIFQVLGTPTEETWPGVSSLSDYRSVWPQFKPMVDFFKNNDSLSDCYKELLTKGFILDPAQRPSAKSLLEIVKKYAT